MKKYIGFLFALLFLVSSAVFAAVGVQNAGTSLGAATDINCSTGLSCTSDGSTVTVTTSLTPSLTTLAVSGVSTLSGNIVGDGGDTIAGFKRPQITSTTTTLTIAQCGSTIVNDSADVLTLPEASTALGCRYTFAVANASNLDINPNDGTDIISPFADYAGAGATVSPSAGDAIRGATVGMSITLEAVGNDRWVVIGGAQGTWADVN